MRLYLYGNGGGIDRIIEDISNSPKTYGSLKEVMFELKERYYNQFDIHDLFIQYYGYDNRLNKDVYIIVTSQMGEEDYVQKYGCPQFVSYLISL